MAKLDLFGETLDLPAAGFKGPLGGLANQLVASVSPGAGGLSDVRCEFDGRLPLGSLEPIAFVLHCEEADGRYRPRRVTLKTAGRLLVDNGLGFPALDTGVIGAAVSRRPGQSVLLRTDMHMAKPLLDRLTSGTAVTLDASSYADDDFWISADFRGKSFHFEPMGAARLSVKHFYEQGGRFESDQSVPMAAVQVTRERITVAGRTDRLYVHGDLVDKRPRTTGNDVFFQHVLVNGELQFSAPLDDPARVDLKWSSVAGSSEPPVLLALRWRDENGHPLAFQPRSGDFTLGERSGFNFAVPDGTDADLIELANHTVGVTASASQAWVLRSLDPVAHYRWDETHAEYGPVTLSPGAPLEIHGMATGVVLQTPANSGGAGLACDFSCSEVKDKQGRVIAWLPEIALGGDGPEWALQAFLEERDSRAGAALSRRQASAKSGSRGPTLPLVDAMAVGMNLLPPAAGGIPYQGLVFGALGKWLAGHDEQFVGRQPAWLASPAMLAEAPQAHLTGFALVPRREELGRVIGQLRASGDLEALVPASPRLVDVPSASLALAGEAAAAQATGYVHGLQVDGQFDAKLREIEQRLSQAPVWNEAWVRLMNQWVTPDVDVRAALDEVRRMMNVKSSLPPPLPEEWSEDVDLQPWLDLKDRAWEMASMGDLDDIEAFEGEGFADLLDGMHVEEFAAVCLLAAEDVADESAAPFVPLVRWLDAPMGPDLFRRVVRLLLSALAPGANARFEKLVQECTAGGLQLQQFCERLLGASFLAQAGNLLGNLKGILTDLGVADAAILQQIRDAWETGSSSALQALKDRFGPVLTDDLLDRIAADADDARKLVAALGEAGIAVHDLADLLRRPPEYLFATRRFASLGADWDKALRLWSGRFDLAHLAEGLTWNFFLGDSSTILVKLGNRRPIDALLQEAHDRFRNDARPDPLGLADLDPRNKTIEGGLRLLRNKFGSALLSPSWVGLLILRPTADISEDLKMRDLCGLEYIDLLYVAVSGRPLEDGRLDVTAAIESRSEEEAVAELKGRPPEEWQGDVDFGLTRFSVNIRRSVLDAADIAFQLRVKNLLGKEHPKGPQAPDVQTITIRGTLAPADPAKPGKARDIQFAAVLEPPKKIPTELLCFDHVLFAGLRVGTRDGRTFLDIDADIKFRKMSDAGYPDFFESIEQLKLRGFRIGLPSLQPGEARSIGEAIGLDFDWPSVEFSMPRARGLQLFGLEVTPLALGILRDADAQWDAFREKFLDIDNWQLPNLGQHKIEVPHVRFRAAFGSLPALGVAGKLSFDLVFGLLVKDGKPERPFIAVDGVAGKKITIDLFRLITITIDQLIFKRNWTFKLDGHPEMKASGLVVDRAELKILNWNPFGEGAHLSLANFHRTDTNDEYQRHGFVAGYEKKKNKGTSSKGFVKVHWIVLGQNIELRKEAYDYLLSSGSAAVLPGTDTESLLTELLVYQDAEDKNAQLPAGKQKKRELVEGQLAATFTKRPSWLFGISFSLGDVLELGNLVLHDQHYYGIRLRDRRWVAAVFGQDTIEFAYIPGARRELDRFRTNLRVPLLDMLGPMTSGEVALEWAVNWDFLIDIGFPWKTAAGHNWFRAFSLPVGAYEGKFGFFLEKKTTYDVAPDSEVLMLGCGAAFYVGLYAGYGNSVAFVRAGIGVFGMYEGRFWLKNANLSKPETLLKATIVRMEVSGTVGIFAYAEGRIEVWILSASFRAWAEASMTSTIIYVPGGTCAVGYSALLAAGYSASVKVGSGWFSWTFRVSGSVAMSVSGRLLLA